MSKSLSPKALEAQYAERERAILALSSKGVISASDLLDLDRLGRCQVANELWALCDQSARNALLRDEHPHVRSCAVLAA